MSDENNKQRTEIRRFYPVPACNVGPAAKFITARFELMYSLGWYTYTLLSGREDRLVKLHSRILFDAKEEVKALDFLKEWGRILPKEIVRAVIAGVPTYFARYRPAVEIVGECDQSFMFPLSTVTWALARPSRVSRIRPKTRQDGSERPLHDRKFCWVEGEESGSVGVDYGISIFGSADLNNPEVEKKDDCIILTEWEHDVGAAAHAMYKMAFGKLAEDKPSLAERVRSMLVGMRVELKPEAEDDDEAESDDAANPSEPAIRERSVRRRRIEEPKEERKSLEDHGPRREVEKPKPETKSRKPATAAKPEEKPAAPPEPPKPEEEKPADPNVKPRIILRTDAQFAAHITDDGRVICPYCKTPAPAANRVCAKEGCGEKISDALRRRAREKTAAKPAEAPPPPTT